MVVINRYTSTQIGNLSSTAARVVYDNTLNVLRFNNATNYANILIHKDLSNNVSNINNVISTGKFGINSTSPAKQVEINSTTGDCLRLTYNDNTGSATNYTDISVSSSGNLSLTPSGGDLDVTTHNGSTHGLKLGGVLVTSTATELNYVDVASIGICEASKAAVLDVNRNLVNVNYLETNYITSVAYNSVNDSVKTAGQFITVPNTTAEIGLGTGIEFALVNDNSDIFNAGYFNCVVNDITSDAEKAYFEFKLANGGLIDTVATLSNNGILTATSFAETSDRRLKENIKDVRPKDSLIKLLSVNVKTYNYTFDSDKKNHCGVIAQEVKEEFPEIVNIQNGHGLDDYHSVQYTGLVPHLINAIKELKKEINDLNNKMRLS